MTTVKINWDHIEHKLYKEAEKFLHETYGMELSIPVKTNGRLKRLLGSFVLTGYSNIEMIATRIEISKDHVRYYDWDEVLDTLKHECVHYALFKLGKPFDDGHPYFESELKRLGIGSTGTVKHKGKLHVYRCAKCHSEFSYLRRLKNNGKYHYHCNDPIVYKGEIVK